jgi:hypothetical protein
MVIGDAPMMKFTPLHLHTYPRIAEFLKNINVGSNNFFGSGGAGWCTYIFVFLERGDLGAYYASYLKVR